MPEEKLKYTGKEDNLSIMIGLDLSSRALADYFSLKLSLKQNGKNERETDEEINKQFSIGSGKKPIGLAEMLGDFTYSFLGIKDIKAWTSKDSVTKMQDERKYALKLIGKRVKGNRIEMPEEQRGFDYIVSHLISHVETIKSKNESKKEEAYEKLHNLFSKILEVAEGEVDKLVQKLRPAL